MHDNKSLKVMVEDNGIGMKRSETISSKKDTHRHMGMDMVSKRLELLGKKLSVTTRLDYSEVYPGSQNPGTRVEILVPMYSG
jgi:sensor histidine kinase YesM